MSKEELWCQRLESWRHSGLSIRRFCDENGLTYSNFFRWRKILYSKPQSAFISVEAESELEFSVCGIDLRTEGDLAVEDLARLIAAARLASQAC